MSVSIVAIITIPCIAVELSIKNNYICYLSIPVELSLKTSSLEIQGTRLIRGTPCAN